MSDTTSGEGGPEQARCRNLGMAEPGDLPTCITCRMWEPRDGLLNMAIPLDIPREDQREMERKLMASPGYCRLNPPDVDGHLPPVRARDWCGQWVDDWAEDDAPGVTVTVSDSTREAIEEMRQYLATKDWVGERRRSVRTMWRDGRRVGR